MKNLTDEQLNKAMMNAIGYEESQEEVSSYFPGKTWQCPTSGAHFATAWYLPCDEDNPENWLDAPHDFCNDKNTHGEIFAALKAADDGKSEHVPEYQFYRALNELTGAKNIVVGWMRILVYMNAPARLIVTAALMALGKLPEEARTEEE